MTQIEINTLEAFMNEFLEEKEQKANKAYDAYKKSTIINEGRLRVESSQKNSEYLGAIYLKTEIMVFLNRKLKSP